MKLELNASRVNQLCPELNFTFIFLHKFIAYHGFFFSIKEVPLDGVLSTKSSQNKGILKDTVPNKSNLSGHGSLLSRSGSYLGTLEKSHDQNEGLGFHCSFETDGSSGQEIDIPSTQPVSHDKILEGTLCSV